MFRSIVLAAAAALAFALPVSAEGGSVEDLTIAARDFDAPAPLKIWLPEGFRGDTPRPVVLVINGSMNFGRNVELGRRLDGHFAGRDDAPVVVGFDFPDRGGRPELARHVKAEVLPELERRWPGLAKAPWRGVLGFSWGANEALAIAVAEPGLFQRVALQSPGWMRYDRATDGVAEDFTERTLAEIAAAPAGERPQVWMMWGDADEAWESRSRANGARVAEALRARGVAVTIGDPVQGGHGVRLISESLPAAMDWLAR